MRKYIIRLDDISWDMNHKNFNRIKALLCEYNVVPLIGVIPDNKDDNLKEQSDESSPDRQAFWHDIRYFCDILKWNVAMHGYEHVYVNDQSGILGLNNFSEFAGLPYKEQFKKIQEGKRILENNGIHTNVFMAPGHTFDSVTLSALRKSGFSCITDGIALFPYKSQGFIFIPQTWWWPHKGFGGIETVAFHINEWNDTKFQKFEKFLKKNAHRCVAFSDVYNGSEKYLYNRYEIINGVYAKIYRIEKKMIGIAAKIKRRLWK